MLDVARVVRRPEEERRTQAVDALWGAQCSGAVCAISGACSGARRAASMSSCGAVAAASAALTWPLARSMSSLKMYGTVIAIIMSKTMFPVRSAPIMPRDAVFGSIPCVFSVLPSSPSVLKQTRRPETENN